MLDICVNFSSHKPQGLNPEALIADSRAAGVQGIVAAGTSLQGSRAAVALSHEHPGYVFATAGLHPHVASAWPRDHLAFDKLWESPYVRLVGECGLDYFRMLSTRDEQVLAFEQHIAAAQRGNKPLLLHEREAFEEFVSVLRGNWSRPRGVVHCFTGGPEQAEAYLDMGLDLGVTGWVCDPQRGGSLRRALVVIPLDRLHLETDSPYLTPKNAPKSALRSPNKPSNLRYIVEQVAALKQVSVAELAETCNANSLRLLGGTHPAWTAAQGNLEPEGTKEE